MSKATLLSTVSAQAKPEIRRRNHAFLTILLLLLAACQSENTVPPDTTSETPLFEDVAAASGLDFMHANGMSGEKYFVEMAGAGGALFDYDNDGDLDVYAVQGHPIGETANTSVSAVYQDRLYRNDLTVQSDGSRAMTFTDVTEESQIRAQGYGMGIATGDFNNDGHTDLYVTNWGPNQIWQNNGDGTFTEVTQPGITDDPRWSTSAAFVDFDRDGWLDLMVVNYVAYRLENEHPCFATRSGRRDYCGPQSYTAEPDRLLRNRGNGTFEDVTVEMGLSQIFGAGLGIAVADFNEDGWPDLYIANDGMENQLWINREGQRFENEAVKSGTALNMSGAAEASMGVVAADFDDDGDEDLFMTHLNGETNTLYMNAGGGLFEDRSRPAGLGQASWPYTAFGTDALDYDLDGWLDLFVANGEVRIIPAQADANDPLPLRQPNQLFHNTGSGIFEEIEDWAGDASDLAEVSRGTAFGDLDNDGDTDILVFNNNGPARLLRNMYAGDAAWLGLRLIDRHGRDALGARAALDLSDGTTRWRRSHTEGSYASSHDPRVLFGLGQHSSYERLRILWPDGTVETWTDLPTHAYHTLIQGEGQPAP